MTQQESKQLKLDFLLDLFDAHYKNAYVSVMDFTPDQKNPCQKIEIFLQNVGRLSLYQSFDERLDEQIPYMEVFCFNSVISNTEIQITDATLLNRAVKIIYKAKQFFENHPEYSASGTDLMRRIKNNQNFLQKRHAACAKKQYGILQLFSNIK